MIVYITIIAALICFILYVLDRRMRDESIDWMTALKISLVGALLSGGVGYAMSENPAELVKAVVEKAPELAQEMFVGTPSF
jgi:uncharacterized membrane protein YsdA (DUF1294 family)